MYGGFVTYSQCELTC